MKNKRECQDGSNENRRRSQCVLCLGVVQLQRITVSYIKRLTNTALGRLQAFRMYGGIGMSTSSLHSESTDSLIPQ